MSFLKSTAAAGTAAARRVRSVVRRIMMRVKVRSKRAEVLFLSQQVLPVA
jgi:hypothetical protein